MSPFDNLDKESQKKALDLIFKDSEIVSDWVYQKLQPLFRRFESYSLEFDASYEYYIENKRIVGAYPDISLIVDGGYFEKFLSEAYLTLLHKNSISNLLEARVHGPGSILVEKPTFYMDSFQIAFIEDGITAFEDNTFQYSGEAIPFSQAEKLRVNILFLSTLKGFDSDRTINKLIKDLLDIFDNYMDMSQFSLEDNLRFIDDSFDKTLSELMKSIKNYISSFQFKLEDAISEVANNFFEAYEDTLEELYEEFIDPNNIEKIIDDYGIDFRLDNNQIQIIYKW